MSRDEEKKIGDDMTICDAQRIIAERILAGEPDVMEKFARTVGDIIRAETIITEE